MKKIYILATTAALLALGGCFQKLDQDPDFDYPEQPAPPAYNPRKLALTFENEAKDASNYKILTTQQGPITYTAGKIGKAYKGGEKTYIIIQPTKAKYPGDISVQDTIANLGSFTVAFWMKTEQVSKGTGIFSIVNKKKFWSNLDIFLDGNKPSETEGRFKMHLYNGKKEKWVEKKIANTIGEWVHLAFRYDSKTEKITIHRNGEEVVSEAAPKDFGSLVFENLGEMVLGTFPFQAEPSLTSGAKAQTWAQSFPGELDQFYFYNKALSDEAIKALYNEK
ncbi:LamG domain-containing protein [Capnocytophaga haemolytica]